MNTPDLMQNEKFRELIEGFAGIIQTSAEFGLDEARKKCTQFFTDGKASCVPIKKVDNITIQGKDGTPVPLRIYTPALSGPLPIALYFHRGGWIFGNIEESDEVCRLLANHLGCIIVSVEYRLSPEHSFPKPLEDCYAATEWVAKNAAAWSADPKRLIVCGESAGGNLAAAVAIMARDQKGPDIAAQLLIYPMITASIMDEPYASCPDRHFITKDGVQFMWNAYLGSPDNANHPYASLDQVQNLSDLPPAVIITAEYDPLYQEGENYADTLEKAGVSVQRHRFAEVIHGFLDLPLYTIEQKTAWIQAIQKMLLL